MGVKRQLGCQSTRVIWNRKKGTPSGWIPFRESLIVVLGGSDWVSLRERYRSPTTALQSRKRLGKKQTIPPAHLLGGKAYRRQLHQFR